MKTKHYKIRKAHAPQKIRPTIVSLGKSINKATTLPKTTKKIKI